MSLVKRDRIGLLCGAVALLTVFGGGCNEAPERQGAPEVARNVRVLPVVSGSMSEYFEVSGPVVPVRGTNLSAQESGPVVQLAVAKGAEVRAGEVLVVQEREILRAERAAAKSARALQAYNVDKVRRLHEAGKVSELERLTAESAFAEAGASAAVADQRYGRAAVKAPFAGVVADRFVELGQLVQPGMPVVRVIDPYTLKLEAYLTAEQVRWVAAGTPANVVLDDPSAPAPGRVSWVGFEADRKTGKFKLEIELPNADLRLRSGVIGRARLGKRVLADVISIPRDAVLPDSAGMSAYVVQGRRAVRRPVTLGATQGLMVEVVAGLAVGDSLVVRGQRSLQDGSLVRVTEVSRRVDGRLDGDPAVVTGQHVGSRIPQPDQKVSEEAK